MRAGRLNFMGNGVVDVFYEFVGDDTIQFVVPSGNFYYTHYKSLIL